MQAERRGDASVWYRKCTCPSHLKCTGASFLILDMVEHRISEFRPIQALECDQLGKGRACNSNRICRTTVAPTRSSWRMRRRMGRRRPLRRRRTKRWWCTHLSHWKAHFLEGSAPVCAKSGQSGVIFLFLISTEHFLQIRYLSGMRKISETVTVEIRRYPAKMFLLFR